LDKKKILLGLINYKGDNMNKYVLLDFWANWCHPCKLMNPVLDQIEKEYPNIKIVKINVDEDSAMVQEYNITSVPTYILIKEDKEIISFATGAMPKYKFIKELGLE
jgi:thioredoxin 1